MKFTGCQRADFRYRGGHAPSLVRATFVHWQPLAGILIAAVCWLAASLPTEAREPNFPDFDLNKNAQLEPNEVPTEYFAIISRYASLARLDIKKSMPIKQLAQGRVEYFRSLDRRNDPGNVWDRPADERGFGKVPGKVGVRPFGDAGEMTAEYTNEVWQNTIDKFGEFDRNRDGLLSRDEAGASLKSDIHAWFRGDRDKNGLLTFVELSHYFGSQRVQKRITRARQVSTWQVDGVTITRKHREHADLLMRKFDKNRNGNLSRDEVPERWMTGNGMILPDTNKDSKISLEEMQHVAAVLLAEDEKAQKRKENPDLKLCQAVASDMLRRYDFNKDKALDRGEVRAIGGNVGSADANNNGLIRDTELVAWLTDQLASQPSSKLPDGLPIWFVESDLDFDGQVLLSEFLRSQGRSSTVEFAHFDHNGDGIVTSAESVSRAIGGKKRYTRGSPQILEANKETESELSIDENVIIADIDVEISIFKKGHDDIELRLIGPDGTTVELFYNSRSKPWGNGPLFENTLIDDEAPEILVRLPSPPAHRSFRPQSMQEDDMPSLSAFYGQPARGAWHLVVRNKGRAAGLLEGWSLLVKPAESSRRGRNR